MAVLDSGDGIAMDKSLAAHYFGLAANPRTDGLID
jgi:hypothetical protein